jgi:hypothetical protein
MIRTWPRRWVLPPAAVCGFEETHTPQRRFTGLDNQAGPWPVRRWVIVKAEANAQATNRRFIVGNRPGRRSV